MFTNKKQILLWVGLALILSACGRSPKHTSVHHKPYRPLNLSHKSEMYKLGAHHGCLTAAESYKKDHTLFNNDFDYQEGWWAGRRNCEGRDYASY